MVETVDIPCMNLVSWVDPVNCGVVHHQWYTPLHKIPGNLNLRPNVRMQNTKSKVYKIIKDAQTNTNLEERFHNSYHLGSGGITLSTRTLHKSWKDGISIVTVQNQGVIYGIINGGHQYAGAMENKEKILRMLSEEIGKVGQAIAGLKINQYMPFHAIAGLKLTHVSYIAKALNTNVQVTDSALLYSMGVFDDIEKVLTKAKLIKYFGKRGNEKSINHLSYEISDNVVLMEAFNRHQYQDGTKHGTACTSAKNLVITAYGKAATREAFSGMLHLLPDFWILFETVRRTGWDMVTIPMPADKVAWVTGPQTHIGGIFKLGKKEKTYTFPITNTKGNTKLIRSLTLSIMSAFRQFLLLSDNRYEWIMPFTEILDIWQEVGKRMILLADKETRLADKSASGAFKNDSAGVWSGMYKIVGDYYAATHPSKPLRKTRYSRPSL